jgi:DNA repair protein RecO (recombination protein O)
MDQWRDEAVILSLKPHGENGAIISALTASHGRHNGYVYGGQSTKHRGNLQVGNVVSLEWSSRVSDALGHYQIHDVIQSVAPFMDDSLKLGAIMAASSLCDQALPEREGHAGLYHGFVALLNMMDAPEWGAVYVMWEISLLRELGFALDLNRCVAGGDPLRLEYVSPKSGGAVSTEMAGPYKDKLLPLPAFLKPERGNADPEEIYKGLKMTGHFFEHWVFAQHTRGIPDERLRFEDRFARYVEKTKEI